MREKTCCFTGHRVILEDTSVIKTELKAVLIDLIDRGVIYYGAGGARGFDALAAQTVIELKHIYPQVKLILVLPCSDQTKGWNKKDVDIYESIKKQADKVKVLSPQYYSGCMHTRNRHMVDHSSVCVCYKRRASGGTAYTHKYAKESGLRIIEI